MGTMTRSLSDLGRRVADEQDAELDRLVDLGRARERFLRYGQPERAGRKAHPLMIAAAAALMAAGAVLAVLWYRAPEPLHFEVVSRGSSSAGEEGSWLSASPGEAVDLRFSDGSRVSLAERSRARVIELGAEGADLVVENGKVQLDIVSRRESQWQLSLGPFRVQVTGTRFDVDWQPDAERLMVSMREGRVLVSGCMLDEPRPLVAGEVLRASCKEGRVEITSQPAQVTAAADLEVPPPDGDAEPYESEVETDLEPAPRPEPARTATAERVQATPTWKDLAAEGDYKSAYAAAQALGFRDECARAGVGDLMGLGDVARYAGQLADAEHAYGELRRRFPSDDRASVAAFALARIAFDQRGRYSEAARWFGTYLRERPSGSLAREALGRYMESLQRSGDMVGARQAAERYLGRYPTGPHSELGHRLLGN